MPDLAAARSNATRFLVDECTITRDAEGYADDAIDPATLEFASPGGDSAAVFSGACLVGGESVSGQEIGGESVQHARRTVRLPFDAAVPEPGDRLVVTASQNNPHLVDEEFRVIEVEDRSLYVTRLLTVERSVRTS